MSTIEARLIEVCAIVALTLGGYLWVEHTFKAQGAVECRAEIATQTAQGQAQARATEQDWQAKLTAKEQTYAKDISSLARERDAALLSLRNRAPERGQHVPGAAASAAVGAGPADLSAPDAEVAIRLAAAADVLRADYQRCLGWIDTVTDGRR